MIIPVTSSYISASAGTGKTYQLASRYIALLALGYDVSSLIALTFTRKAAGEFRQRIFHTLASGAKFDDSSGRNPLTAQIWESWSGLELNTDIWKPMPAAMSAPLLPQARTYMEKACAKRCYPEQLEELPEPLRLDSRLFCRLLHSLVTSGASLHLSTLDSFFTSIVRTQSLALGVPDVVPLTDAEAEEVRKQTILTILSREDSDTLNELIDNLGFEGKGLLGSMEKAVETYDTLYHRIPKAAWGNVVAFGLSDCLNIPPLTRRDRRKIVDELEALCSAVKVFPVEKYYNAFLDAILEGKYAPDLIEKCDITMNEGGSRLLNAMRNAMERVKENILRTAQVNTSALYNFLHLYNETFDEVAKSKGKFTFDLITRKADDFMGAAGAPGRLAYMLDGHLCHWLLDEFQDTSPQQWHALSGLLDEVAQSVYAPDEKTLPTSEKSLFVVGDEKQSIYGFRGATPELFSNLKDPNHPLWSRIFLPGKLTRSRRSAPVIMEYVNKLFRKLNQDEYTDHSSAMEKFSGSVEIKSVHKDHALEALLEVLDNLTIDGCPRNKMTIAILVSKNDESKEIADFLHVQRPRLPVQTIADVNLAISSPFGQIILSFFKWLHHPSDTYRKTLVALSPLREALQTEVNACDGSSRSRWLRLIEERGYAETVRHLVSLLHKDETLADSRTVREWMNAAWEFDRKGGSMKDWLRYVENLTRRAEGASGVVQIMTMHKSKGVEFDVVILPFRGTRGVDHASNFKYYRDGEKALLLAPCSATEAKHLPQLSASLEAWRQEAIAEAHRLLYVALTRAKHANYIIINNKAHKKSFSDMIRQSLPESNGIDWFIFPGSDPKWYLHTQKPMTEQTDVPTPSQPLGNPPKLRKKIHPSQVEENTAQDLAETLDLPTNEISRKEASEFGTAVHARFEELEWLDKDLPKWMDDPSGDEATQLVSAALHDDAVRNLFIRPKGTVFVYREQNLESIEGDVWISATIDRLVVREQNALPVEAHIIDFKTDAIGADAAALKLRHRKQMQAYRTYVSQALGLEKKNVRVSLVSVPRTGKSFHVHTYTDEELD